MCRSPAVAAERFDRLEALLHALRVVTVSREVTDGSDDTHAASLFLIKEVEIGLTSLSAELKHCQEAVNG